MAALDDIGVLRGDWASLDVAGEPISGMLGPVPIAAPVTVSERELESTQDRVKALVRVPVGMRAIGRPPAVRGGASHGVAHSRRTAVPNRSQGFDLIREIIRRVEVSFRGKRRCDMSDCRLNQYSEPFVSVGEMRRGFLAAKRQKSLFSAFGPLLVPQNRIYPVTCRRAMRPKLGIIGKWPILLFGADFSCRSRGRKCRERLFFASRGNVFGREMHLTCAQNHSGHTGTCGRGTASIT